MFQPGKRSLDNPTLRNDFKCRSQRSLGDLYARLELLSNGLGKGFACVAAVSQHTLNAFQFRAALLDGFQRPLAIIHVRGCHMQHMRQALRIHADVTLDPTDLLAAIITFIMRRVGVWHALRINNDKAR